MTKVIIAVRDFGHLKPDYYLDFELPEVPKPGQYVAIFRGAPPEHSSEDMIVDKVWWQLNHPETGAIGRTPGQIGNVLHIIVECIPATGPSSSDKWLQTCNAARTRGIEVPEFDVAR